MVIVIHNNYYYPKVIKLRSVRFGGRNLRGHSNRETEHCFQSELSSEIQTRLRKSERKGERDTHGPVPAGSCFHPRP